MTCIRVDTVGDQRVRVVSLSCDVVREAILCSQLSRFPKRFSKYDTRHAESLYKGCCGCCLSQLQACEQSRSKDSDRAT